MSEPKDSKGNSTLSSGGSSPPASTGAASPVPGKASTPAALPKAPGPAAPPKALTPPAPPPVAPPPGLPAKAAPPPVAPAPTAAPASAPAPAPASATATATVSAPVTTVPEALAAGFGAASASPPTPPTEAPAIGAGDDGLRTEVGARPEGTQRMHRLDMPGAETIEADAEAEEEAELIGMAAPPRPRSLEETGLDESFALDLALKHLYFGGELEAIGLADALSLDFRVVEGLLGGLKTRQLIVAAGGSGMLGGIRLRYRLTEEGRNRAEEVLRRDNYVGPAPVPIAQYQEQVRRQRVGIHRVSPARLGRAFADLVLRPEVLDRLGPALNSGESIFLWGAAGNGKTSVAERLLKALGGVAFVPRAVIVERQIVRVFDPLFHKPIPEELDPENLEVRHDGRWILAERPTVMVGGELTLEMLDLTSPGTATWYEAPFQVKANSGMLFIDDFGRQRCDARDLLNRWIVPLESGYDFLTFRSGQKALVPFDNVVVFATNLEPASLVDEAFLRRIRYKVEIGDPSPEEYKRIWARVCASHGIPYVEALADYVLEKHYRAQGRPLRSCHPRDLLEQLVDLGRYLGARPPLDEALVDRFCGLYFGGITL